MSSRKNSPLNEEDATMDMSPMIDMVFLLLVFFLVNANMISVKIDQNVETPTGSNSKPQLKVAGRIVVNIRPDGSIYNDDGTQRLDDAGLTNYIVERKAFFENKRESPRLHLRGDKKAVFRFSQKVMAAAGAQGIDEVMFAVVDPKK